MNVRVFNLRQSIDPHVVRAMSERMDELQWTARREESEGRRRIRNWRRNLGAS